MRKYGGVTQFFQTACLARRCSTDSPNEKKGGNQLYKRHSSNPQTLREKAAFRRDHKYGRYRPLPDAPWRRYKKRTYLDDAERLYGRKETWASVEDDALREKLVAILQDYLRDTLAAARLEAKDARKYRSLCDMSAREYRAHLRAGAFSSPELFEEWIAHVGTRRTATTEGEDSTSPAATTTEEDSSTIKEAPSTSTRSAEELEAEREERRLRGEQADLTDTAALSGLPLSDLKHTPREAFPFLRKRAVEEEHTLDPSLVDWTAKYYPEDTKDTFARPPKVRSDQSQEAAPTEVVEQESAQRERGPSRSAHARHRLNQSLRKHDDHYRATFDADGVFFHMRTPDFSDEENDRTPRPRQVKGSELDDTLRKKRGVVKVPWNVAAKAQEQGYSTDILRSKEQLIRLSRGEDPRTIP